MITKNSDFKGRFNIAGAEDLEPNSFGNNEELELFIEEFEPKCLVTVLGFALYQELLTNLEPDGTVKPGADDKWKDLVNGKDQWRGLKTVTVPYIYFYFIESDESHHTGVGIVQENPKGAERTTPRWKMVNAWRAFYESAHGKSIYNEIIARPSYLGYIVGKVYDNDDDKFWSLYKFLEERSEDFPNASPSELSNMNYYGV